MKYIYNRVKVIILNKNKSIFTLKFLIGIIAGGCLGFLYYLLTNITNHPPTIATTPWFSTIYGILLGGVITRR